MCLRWTQLIYSLMKAQFSPQLLLSFKAVQTSVSNTGPMHTRPIQDTCDHHVNLASPWDVWPSAWSPTAPCQWKRMGDHAMAAQKRMLHQRRGDVRLLPRDLLTANAPISKYGDLFCVAVIWGAIIHPGVNRASWCAGRQVGGMESNTLGSAICWRFCSWYNLECLE